MLHLQVELPPDSDQEAEDLTYACRVCNADCVSDCIVPWKSFIFQCPWAMKTWMDKLRTDPFELGFKSEEGIPPEQSGAKSLFKLLSDNLGNTAEYKEWCLTEGRELEEGEDSWKSPESWDTLTKFFPVFFEQYLKKQKEEGEGEHLIPAQPPTEESQDTKEGPGRRIGLVSQARLSRPGYRGEGPEVAFQEASAPQDIPPASETTAQQTNAKLKNHKLIINFDSTVKQSHRPSDPVDQVFPINLVVRMISKTIDDESRPRLASRVFKLRTPDKRKIQYKLRKLVKTKSGSGNYMSLRLLESMMERLNDEQLTELDKEVEICERLDLRHAKDWDIFYAIDVLSDYRKGEVFQIIHQNEPDHFLLRLGWTIAHISKVAGRWDPTHRMGETPLISELRDSTKREIISYIRNTNNVADPVVKNRRPHARFITDLVKDAQRTSLARQAVINNMIARLEPGKQGVPANEDGTGEAIVDFDTLLPSTLNAVQKFLENKSIMDEQFEKDAERWMKEVDEMRTADHPEQTEQVFSSLLWCKINLAGCTVLIPGK